MKKLNVFFNNGIDSKFIVGQLALSKKRIYFEYDADFLKNPIWLSPFKLPPEPGLKEHKSRSFGNLFGLFNDSLPDGWGLLLMNRFLRNKGINISELTSLDRLAFFGNSTMGALTYEPACNYEKNTKTDFNLHLLAQQSRQIIEGETDIVLPQLMRAGGSPGGARPKILAGIHEDKIITGEDELPIDFQHWIIKFNSKNDLKDSGNVEYAYSLMAVDAGIEMTDTRLFKTEEGESFFGIKRFDRKGKQRFHVHTFGNMIHADFRVPATDYEDFFKVTRILTKNHQDTLRVFKQMIFNILANNRDDHVKNFSFLIGESQEWRLSPAYDLTWSEGPGGEHSMTIIGEGKSPGKKEIEEIGKRAGLSGKEISHSFEQIISVVSDWQKYAETAGVTNKSMGLIKKSIGNIAYAI